MRAAKPDANYYHWVDSNWTHYRPNMAYAPFTDFRVRKGMMLATDVAAFGDGWGYQASLLAGYPEAWKPDKMRHCPGTTPTPRRRTAPEA